MVSRIAFFPSWEALPVGCVILNKVLCLVSHHTLDVAHLDEGICSRYQGGQKLSGSMATLSSTARLESGHIQIIKFPNKEIKNRTIRLYSLPYS